MDRRNTLYAVVRDELDLESLERYSSSQGVEEEALKRCVPADAGSCAEPDTECLG